MTTNQAPLRDVIKGMHVKGPRGGNYVAMWLSCGHWVWKHGTRMVEQTRCIGCYIEAEVDRIEGNEGRKA